MTIFRPRSRMEILLQEGQFPQSLYVPVMKLPFAGHPTAATPPSWITLRSARLRNLPTKAADLARSQSLISDALLLRFTLGVPCVRKGEAQ